MPRKSLSFPAFLATSFLGAFNDNFFKLLLVCLAKATLSEDLQKSYLPLTGAVFVLPYLVCSGYAGFISDRFRKSSVIIWAKVLELAVMIAGFFLLRQEAAWALLPVLFLMGAQSALYSPAKYGYLPETLSSEKLGAGNGVTQLWTFLAIIAGTGLGGLLKMPLICVVVSALGILTALFVQKTRDGDPNRHFSINPLNGHWKTAKIVFCHPSLRRAMLGNSFFWFVGALYQNHLPLCVSVEALPYILGTTGLGIGLGSMLAGKMTREATDCHLIRPACFAMAILSMVISLAIHLSPIAFIGSFLLGITTGIYQLPHSTVFQQLSPETMRGSCLALSNASDCIAMLLAYFFQWFLLKVCSLPSPMVFLAMGLLILAVAIWEKPPCDDKKISREI